MDAWVARRSTVPLTVSTRPPYPRDATKPCGDGECINGPPHPEFSTYFLCQVCSRRAPDAIALGYALRPKKMKPGDHQKINATVLSAFIRLESSQNKPGTEKILFKSDIVQAS